MSVYAWPLCACVCVCVCPDLIISNKYNYDRIGSQTHLDFFRSLIYDIMYIPTRLLLVQVAKIKRAQNSYAKKKIGKNLRYAIQSL